MALISHISYDSSISLANAEGRALAKCVRRSHDAVIRIYDEAGNVIETHEHAGEFKDHSG
jgi:hypothetical protein